MMGKKAKYKIVNGANYKLAKLPFQRKRAGVDISMFVLLPHSEDSIVEALDKLNSAELLATMKNCNRRGSEENTVRFIFGRAFSWTTTVNTLIKAPPRLRVEKLFIFDKTFSRKFL